MDLASNHWIATGDLHCSHTLVLYYTPAVNPCSGYRTVLAQAIARGLFVVVVGSLRAKNGANTGDKGTWSNYGASSCHLRCVFSFMAC